MNEEIGVKESDGNTEVGFVNLSLSISLCLSLICFVISESYFIVLKRSCPLSISVIIKGQNLLAAYNIQDSYLVPRF